MNDIAKQRIVDKLFESLKLEGITQSEVAKMFHVDGSYITSMKYEKYWHFVPATTWELFIQWVNSGQRLREYCEKHGKVVPEKKESIRDSDITPDFNLVKESENIKVDKTLYSVNLAEIGWIKGLHDKGKSVEQISKELGIYIEIVKMVLSQPDAPTKVNHEKIVDLLIEEKAVLIEKVNAIDFLLKHYTE